MLRTQEARIWLHEADFNIQEAAAKVTRLVLNKPNAVDEAMVMVDAHIITHVSTCFIYASPNIYSELMDEATEDIYSRARYAAESATSGWQYYK